MSSNATAAARFAGSGPRPGERTRPALSVLRLNVMRIGYAVKLGAIEVRECQLTAKGRVSTHERGMCR